MKRLLSYMKDYRKESILGPLFKMLEASFELLVPLVVASMVDVGIRNRDGGYIMKMGGLLLLLALVGLACSLTAQYFAAKAATGAGTALRNDLYKHIGTLSYAEIDSVGTATLITRMTSDINQVQNGINMTLRLLLRSPFVVFGAMIMAFTVDLRSAMVFVVTIPVLCVVVFGIMLVSMPDMLLAKMLSMSCSWARIRSMASVNTSWRSTRTSSADTVPPSPARFCGKPDISSSI